MYNTLRAIVSSKMEQRYEKDEEKKWKNKKNGFSRFFFFFLHLFPKQTRN